MPKKKKVKKIKKIKDSDRITHLTIVIDVFETYMEIVICSKEKFESYAKEKLKHLGDAVEKNPLDSCEAKIYLHTGYSSSTIWLPRKAPLWLASHEILHGVFHLCEATGIEYSSESEEIFTYLMGYITKEYIRLGK